MKEKTGHLFGITVTSLLLLIVLCVVLMYFMHIKTIEKRNANFRTEYAKENEVDDKKVNENDNNTKTTEPEESNEQEDNVEVAEIETQAIEDIINYRLSLAESAEIDIQNNQNSQRVDTSGFSKDRYFYSQLDTNAKRIYDAVISNKDRMKTGTAQIKLDKSISNILKERDGQTILSQEFQSAWDAISLDHPELFYIDISKVNLIIKKFSYVNRVEYELYIAPQAESYLKSNYASTADIEKALNDIKWKKEEILANFSGSNYDKALQVHDYLINNMQYSADNYDSYYDIYGALIEEKGV